MQPMSLRRKLNDEQFKRGVELGLSKEQRIFREVTNRGKRLPGVQGQQTGEGKYMEEANGT